MKLIDRATGRNLASLFLLQAGNYLVPLAVLPWLTQRLQPAGYGTVAFALAFGGYFVVLVDWGFSLSATRQVAIFKDSLEERSEIFWNTFSAKCFMAFVSFFVLEVLIYSFEALHGYELMLRLAYLAALGAAITPVFYYQGLEKVTQMALINVAVKAATIPLVYVLVTGPGDEPWAVGIQAGVILAAGVINAAILFLGQDLIFKRPTFLGVVQALKEGSAIFVSNAAISLYTNTNVVILKFVANPAAAGYFFSAQNIVKAVCGLYGPISQVLFPKMSHLFHHDKNRAIEVFRNTLIFQAVLAAILSVGLYLSAEWVVLMIFGAEYENSVMVLELFSPLPLLLAVSNVLGVQTMVPLGNSRAFSSVLLMSGMLNLLLAFVLGAQYAENGVAMAVVITELSVVLLMVGYLAVYHRYLLLPQTCRGIDG